MEIPPNKAVSALAASRSPKDIFLYIGMIIALYFWVVNFITLAFSLLNAALPDKLAAYVAPYSIGEIRFNLASLIIVFPVFLILSWLIDRSLRANPEKLNAFSRKFALYLTLFLTGATAVCDLVALVYVFLEGEITVRFVLKALILLIVVAKIFAYYLYELRKKDGAHIAESNVPKLMVYGSSLVILVLIVLSFIVIGSPATQRKVAFDEQRVTDLQAIQSEVNSFWYSNSLLPADLSALQQFNTYSALEITDPETGAPYTYLISTSTKDAYELCATFDLPSSSDPAYTAEVTSDPSGPNGSWQHDAGNACFNFTAPTTTSSSPAAPRAVSVPPVPVE